MKLTFHSDSGHGWLAVPVQLLKELGIQDQITVYSYLYKGVVYLEEDLDAGTFLDAAKAAGIEIEIGPGLYAYHTPIRNYPAYKWTSSLDN